MRVSCADGIDATNSLDSGPCFVFCLCSSSAAALAGHCANGAPRETSSIIEFANAAYTFESALCHSHVVLVCVFLGVQCVEVGFCVCPNLVSLGLVFLLSQFGLGENTAGVHMFCVLLYFLGIARGYAIFQ